MLDQPVSTAMPEDKGNNISTSELRERANTDGAEWDIYENRGTQDLYSVANDSVSKQTTSHSKIA